MEFANLQKYDISGELSYATIYLSQLSFKSLK